MPLNAIAFPIGVSITFGCPITFAACPPNEAVSSNRHVTCCAASCDPAETHRERTKAVRNRLKIGCPVACLELAEGSRSWDMGFLHLRRFLFTTHPPLRLQQNIHRLRSIIP